MQMCSLLQAVQVLWLRAILGHVKGSRSMGYEHGKGQNVEPISLGNKLN